MFGLSKRSSCFETKIQNTIKILAPWVKVCIYNCKLKVTKTMTLYITHDILLRCTISLISEMTRFTAGLPLLWYSIFTDKQSLANRCCIFHNIWLKKVSNLHSHSTYNTTARLQSSDLHSLCQFVFCLWFRSLLWLQDRDSREDKSGLCTATLSAVFVHPNLRVLDSRLNLEFA